MTRNLAAIQMNESGVSNAGVLGLQKPKTIVDKVAFCKEYLRADRTEMVNRPAFGLSMFTGTLVALRKNLEARWTKSFMIVSQVVGHTRLQVFLLSPLQEGLASSTSPWLPSLANWRTSMSCMKATNPQHARLPG